SSESLRPQDCGDLQRAGQIISGVYVLFPTANSTGVAAYCDMETEAGGWTVIQKRGQYGNNAYHFYRNWTEYKTGFGNPKKEYWIGNNALHALTSEDRDFLLRVQLRNETNGSLVAYYKTFRVASEGELYKLTIGDYYGPPGSDSLTYANGANFSTFDQDNDKDGGNCAEQFRGGWWYTACHSSNLNGLNLNGEHASYADGIEWSQLNHHAGLYRYSYPEAQMMIREVNFIPGVDFLNPR
ncbi:unnamed protein product, partial [Ixodes hexagonus]